MGELDVSTNEGRPQSRPRIAFVASREPSYPRVAIVRRELERRFHLTCFTSGRASYPVRVASVLSQFLWALLTGRLRDHDLLFVGFFAQPIFPLLRCLWRRAVISDAFFSLYDTLVNDKALVRTHSWPARLSHWLDRRMLAGSDAVITDTEAHAAYFRREFEAQAPPLRRVFASADDTVFNQLAPLAFQPGQPFEVLFWGGFIPLQGVEIIVRAAARVSPADVHFTIVGEGQTRTRCESLATDLGLRNVAFVGWQSPQRLVELSEQAHLVLGIFGTSEKAQRVIPNKAFQALALGKPLITSDSPAARELLAHRRDALLVPPGDAAALAEAILWAADNYDDALAIAAHGHATFREHASPARAGEDLAAVVREFCHFSSAGREANV